MSYGTKYRVRWKDIVGRECVADVQKQDYSAGVTDLLAAETAVDIEWGEQERQDLTESFMVSSLQLGVVGTADAETMLEEIADTPDQEWRLKYSEAGELFWQGFIAGDLSGANPNRPRETIEVEAIDGLALLENYDAYTDGGQVSAAISRLLRGGIGYTGLHALPIYTSMDWRPSGTVPDGKCPLDVLSFPEKAYKELDEDQEPKGTLDARTNLEGVCERFGLRLFQAGGAWHLRQRDQIDDGTALKRWKMPAGQPSFNDSPTTADVTAEQPHQLRRTEKPQRRVQRLRALSSVHQYADLGELVANGSFEETLSTWTRVNEPNAVREKYDNTPLPAQQTQSETWVLHLSRALTDPAQEARINQDVPAKIHELGPKGTLKLNWEQVDEGGPGFGCETQWQLEEYYVQARNVEVAQAAVQGEDATIYLNKPIPGTDGTVIMPAGAELPITDTYITLSAPLEAGDERIVGELGADVEAQDSVLYWVWSDTQQTTDFGGTTYDHYGLLDAYSDYPTTPKDPNLALQTQKITIPLHTPTGVSLAEKNFQVGFKGNAAFDIYLDRISAELQLGGEPLEETKYIAVDDQYGREVTLTHRVGEGPTKDHPRGLTAGTGEVPSDWKPSPYNGGGPTGKSLEQLLAEQWMRQQRETLDRRTFQFQERGTKIGPHYIYEVTANSYTVTYLKYEKSSSGNKGTVELTEVKDAGLSGLDRAFSMDTSQPFGGGNEGATIINTGDQTIEGASSWDDLMDKPGSLLAANGDSDGFPATQALESADISAAFSHSPGLSDGIQTSIREEGTASDEALVTEQAVREGLATVDDDTTLIAKELVQTQAEIDALGAVVLRKARELEGGQNIQQMGPLGDGQTVATVGRPTFDQVELGEQADGTGEAVRGDRTVEVQGTTNQVGVNGAATTQGALTRDVSVTLEAPQNLHTEADFEVGTLETSADATVGRDLVVDRDATVIGDLFVEGQETVLDTETVEASDNLIFLNAGQQGAGITAGFAGFEADRGTEEPIKLVFDEQTDLGRIGTHYKTLGYSGLSGSFNLYEEVEGQSSGATGIIWKDDGSTLSLKGRTGSFSGGETITGQSSGASATVDSTTQIDDTQALATREDSPATGGIPFFNTNDRIFETTTDLQVVGNQSNEFFNGDEVQVDIGVGHSDYVAELSHWYITPGGLGDFRTLLADELRVEAFIAEVEEALAGADFLTKSFATLDQPFEVPSSSPVGTQKDLTVQDLDGLGAIAVFNNQTDKEDDTLRLRIVDRSDGGLTVADIWLRAIAGSYTDNGDGTQTWTVEILQAGDQGIGAGLTAPEGSVVLDYGVPGDFLIERSVLNPDSGDIAPYDRMLQWTDPDGNRIPDPSDFEVLNLRGRLGGLPKARATGFGVYSETARFTEDVAVGDLAAADAGDESGSYLKFTKSGGLKVVTQGGDVESRTDQNESDLRLLARRVAQERESRAGVELNVGENAAEIELNAEVIGDDSKFSQSTLSLQASQNEADISANNTSIANLEATVGDGTGFSEADLTLQAEQNEDDISANDTAVADLEAIVGDGQNLAEADLTLTASQNTDDISSNDSAIADLSAVVGDDSKFSESTLSLQASQNEDDASSNASAIANLEATVGDDSKFSESTLSLQASQNEADLKLLARRVTQETESRAGLELNVGENAATIQLHTEVLSENGLGASTDITSRVSTAEDDIGINASDISANATDIADNVDAINLNAGDIDSNATAINSLEAQVGDGSISAGADLTQAANVNTGDISDNEGNISQNATAITDLENYVGIDETLAAESNLTLLANANKSDTDQNASDISANATDIADNVDAINLNADDIDSNATAITDIENHVGIDENLAAEANLTLLANANKSDTDENANSITKLENRVGVGENLEVESNLTLAANQNAADIKLVARRVVQQQEATAGIEATVNENSATLLAEVTFEPADSAKDSSRAAMKLVADEDGSSAALVGDSIELTGDTFVDGTFTVDDGTAGGWTVNQTDIRSLPGSGSEGIILSSDLGLQRLNTFAASIRATNDVSNSSTAAFVEFFVSSSDEYGLYAEDGNGNAIFGLGANPAGSKRSDDYFLDGSLVIDGTITADEIDVEDFWATDATVKNSLTMGSSGEITDDASPINYRIDSDGVDFRATDSTRDTATEVAWLEPDLTGTVRGEIYAHNQEMNIASYRFGSANSVQTTLTAYDRPKTQTGKKYARIELNAEQNLDNEVNVVITDSGEFNIRNADIGGVVFDFDPFDWSMGFKRIYNFDSVPGGSPPTPTDGLRLYAKDELTGNDVPYLWFITEDGTQYRIDATPIT
jgi:hypothetical protein